MKKLCKDVVVGNIIALEVVDNSTTIEGRTIYEAQRERPVTLLHVGYFISEDKEFIRIVDFKCSDETCRYVHIIPKQNIMWIDLVTKVKQIYRTDRFENLTVGST